jgi:guanylate kinase
MGMIFCIIGKSGSGKDTVFQMLKNIPELSLRGIVTYTTRPRRDYETDGEQYRFITEETLADFRREGKVIEQRRYDTVRGIWYYCTLDDGQIDTSKGNYIVISTPEAFASLRERFGRDKVMPVYLEVEDGERLKRALEREMKSERPDYNEMCRRFLADSADFSEVKLREYGITKRYDNDTLENCIAKIVSDMRASIK